MKFLIQNNALLDKNEQPCEEASLSSEKSQKLIQIGKVSFLQDKSWYAELQSDIEANPENYKIRNGKVFIKEFENKDMWCLNLNAQKMLDFVEKYKNIKIVDVSDKYKNISFKIII